MSKQLSQAEIDALLNAVGAQPANEAPDVADALPRVGWAAAGEVLASALASALSTAWRRRVPVLSVVRAEALPPGFNPLRPFRVVRLGHPLNQRVWFFWDEPGEAGDEAVEGFLNALEALLPTSLHRQVLPGQTEFPQDGVVLPYRGVTSGDSIPLVLGLEGGVHLRELRDRLKPAGGRVANAAPSAESLSAAAPSSVSTAPVVGAELDGVEVDASVFVGGGHYPLADLAGLRPGSVLTLGMPSEPAVVAINGRVVALGEVVVLADDTLGVRLSQVVLGGDTKAVAPSWMR